MTGTCGPTPSDSSNPCDHAKCTASKSPARLRSDAFQEVLNQTLNLPGSTLYSVTLKQHTTPAGRVSSRPRASARRTSGTEPTGWATPAAHEARLGYQNRRNGKRGTQESLTTQVVNSLAPDSDPRLAGLGAQGWPTATVNDKLRFPSPDSTTPNVTLNHAASRAGWPTPDAQMMNDAADPEKHMARLQRLKEKHGNGNGAGLPIGQACHLAGWPTPDGPARITADGRVLTGSSAEMPSGGQLNPAHSRWLMGYPAAWCLSAVRYIRKKRAASGSKATATRSSRSKPHNSSSPAKQRDPHSISAEDLA